MRIEAFLKGDFKTVNLKECFDDLRYEMIMKAVADHQGCNAKAARALGMKRTALLHYTREKYKKSEATDEQI
jgi:transcriptional regulator with GAF, ATPase, and Fis domain